MLFKIRQKRLPPFVAAYHPNLVYSSEEEPCWQPPPSHTFHYDFKEQCIN